MKQYCPSCYKITNYESTPPKFCSHCGKSFEGNFTEIVANQDNKPVKNTPFIKRKNIPVVVESDDEEILVPQIDLDVTIDKNLRPNRHLFSEIVATHPPIKPSKKPSNKKTKVPEKSREQVYKEWQEQFKSNQRNEIE